MYISTLSLYGFKSFLKKSEIHFGSGVTTVVGPNGCGKTNIVDAIRWVIGEQKSSILRTDRITDVIFNGTSTRRQLNLAEVSLIIHNVSGRIPIEYSDIMITRRIYRNGESEYFINKSLCRLKDITDLFIDTGMGANAYSIIELKMIENILSETFEERKRLFEEAAGVNKYRVQRKAAIRKLDATRDDFVRLTDIITEVESKVKSLRRQLRRYEKYQEVTQKLVDAEVVLASRRVLNIRKNLEPISSEIKEKESKLQKIISELETKENHWQSKQKLFEEKEKLFQEKNIELDKLKFERNKFQTEDLLLKEQYRNVSQTISRLEKEISSLGENISYSEDKENSLQNEHDNIKLKLGKKQIEFQEISSEHQKIELLFKNINKEIQSLYDERYSLLRQQAEYTARYSSLKENIIQREKELELIKGQIEKQTSNEEIINQTIADTNDKVKIFKDNLEKYKEAEKKEKERNLNLIGKERDLTDKMRVLESEQDKLTDRIQFYSGIIQSKEGFSPGLQYVLDNLQDFPGIKGALSDLISVDSRYYLSVEAVIKDISR
ncbi:MAG: AAA family ATPase, partial [Candidatus Marinimicrobia bacterium]|nr:AAA family ATPase [Candidatus Neomarinimicrobiota bacterium]